MSVLENGSSSHSHDNHGGYTEDGTVDLKGNPVLRFKRGGWKACSFIVVYEVFERMAYYGISSNLIIYLTTKLHQGTVTSSNNVTNWVGTIWMTPIMGAYIADAYLGRYWTFLLSSAIYLTVCTVQIYLDLSPNLTDVFSLALQGMGILTLAVSLPSLRPPPCPSWDPSSPTSSCKAASTLQLAIFFGALYTLAIGTGGTKPNISTMGADQFDEFDPRENLHKLSFFNWWTFCVFFGMLFANTILVYIQDNVGWTLGYAIPTLGLVVSISIFLCGTQFYRHHAPTGSPFTRMACVIVSAIWKHHIPLPTDPKELYQLNPEDEYYYSVSNSKNKKGSNKVFIINSTPSLAFLNKASIQTSSISPSWLLCPVTQVEQTKQMLLMIPILIATFIPCIMIAQTNTLFIKQGTTLDRNIGPHFQIPPATLTAFVNISMLISIILYDQCFVPIARKITNNPRGITMLQRMGVGLIIHILVMTIASITERIRLNVAAKHGLVHSGGQVPMSIFVLLPQFALMGTADAFLEVAKLEFFYDQAPQGMKSLGTSYWTTSIGVGHFLSSFLLKTVSKVTMEGGYPGWILNNLNASRLDYYYALLAGLNVLKLIFFLLVVRWYAYKVEVAQSIKC